MGHDRSQVTKNRFRWALPVGWALYLAFVVYGSLVPLSYEPISLATAWARFRALPLFSMDVASRVDVAINILLFVPLSFLSAQLLMRAVPKGWPRTAGMAGIAVGCAALSMAVEFTQLFFPPRTVALNDVYAETFGAVAGLVLWVVWGGALRRSRGRWSVVSGIEGVAEWLLIPYLLLLVVLSLLPLDLTLTPQHMWEKWGAGRIILVPFGYAYASPADRIFGTIFDAAWWIPIAALLTISRRLSPGGAWAATVVLAASVEVAQLFVYSRITDVTDVIGAAAGAGLGVAVALFFQSRGREPAAGVEERRLSAVLFGLGWTVLWVFVVVIASWYPFDFLTDPESIRPRLALLKRVPFASYYFGTEYHAIGKIIQVVMLFAPTGAFLALSFMSLRSSAMRRLAAIASALGLVLLGCAIEAGQVLLPGKLPDTTDVLIGAVAGILGYGSARAISRRIRAGSNSGEVGP